MVLLLKIKPNARKNAIIFDLEGNIRVKISAPPVDGKANKELIYFLSEIFDVPKSHIEIISGEMISIKRVKITGDENKLMKILIQQRRESEMQAD